MNPAIWVPIAVVIVGGVGVLINELLKRHLKARSRRQRLDEEAATRRVQQETKAIYRLSDEMIWIMKLVDDPGSEREVVLEHLVAARSAAERLANKELRVHAVRTIQRVEDFVKPGGRVDVSYDQSLDEEVSQLVEELYQAQQRQSQDD